VHKLFAEVGPRFKDRPGGYSRIIRIGPRPGDAAEMVYLELVDEEYVAKEREARTPEPVVVEEPEETQEPGSENLVPESEETEPEAEEVAEEPEASSDAGADDSADEGDDGPGSADEPK